MTSDKRRRQKEEAAARKAAARKAATRRELVRRIGIALGLGAVVALLLLLASALSGRDEGQLPPDYQAYREQPTACGGEVPPPASQATFPAPDPQDLPEEPVAVIHTSCGEITVRLDPTVSPATVESFAFLARSDFYAGTVFHRVVEGFAIQAGDPTASGRGGPGYTLPDEFPPSDFVYEEGVVAMANAGRGTTGSQFFIVVGEQAQDLPPTFNVIGRVVEGFDTLERIEAVPTVQRSGSVERSKPTETVYVEDVEISSA